MTNNERKIASDFILEEIDITNTAIQQGLDASANNYIIRGACLLLEKMGYDVVVISDNDIRIIPR